MVVLLTDGENTTNPDPLVAAQTAADRGVRIYTVGIGSPAGADLTVDGFITHTQLDGATLQQMAAISDGVYYNAESTDELLTIYDHLTPEFVIEPEKNRSDLALCRGRNTYSAKWRDDIVGAVWPHTLTSLP